MIAGSVCCYGRSGMRRAASIPKGLLEGKMPVGHPYPPMDTLCEVRYNKHHAHMLLRPVC
eukprot:3605257-Rhodomonas_salina.3